MGTLEYSVAVDIWSLGAIFGELLIKRPLFVGDSEIDQLYKIFRLMGTPNEVTWPGVSKLKCFKESFLKWDPSDSTCLFRELDNLGLDLLMQMLRYDPVQRISAREALLHPFFMDLSNS